MIHIRSVILKFVVLALGGGCASPGLSPLTFTVRQSPIVDRATLLDVAQAVLVDEGFELDQVDVAALIVTTQPQPVSTPNAQARAFRLSSRGRRRRLATVQFAREAAATKVYCRVVVEGQMTETRRLQFENDQTSDVPRDTAIDRDAATTIEQNTVWQMIHRDKAAERRIVDQILSRAGELVSPSQP